MSCSVPTVKASTGQLIPILGFGTWQTTDEELEKSLTAALEAGYRHIDTAAAYENEHVIGKVLKAWIDSGKLKREDLFIVTKLPPSGIRPKSIEKWITKSLKDLQVDYLDLYLVHVPFGIEDVEGEYKPIGPINSSNLSVMDAPLKMDPTTDHIAVWKEMERQVALGRTKAIGVSNFNAKQMERILSIAKEPIASLQIELHLYFQQNQMVEFCKKKGITVTAYSPLGTRGLVKLMNKTEEIPDILENPTVLKLAKKHGKTAAQVALRHIVQRGIIAIPKSANPARLKQNISLFDWELSSEDMEALNALDRGEAGRICDFTFLKGAKTHPEFPF